MFVSKNSGLNDNLNGVERPVNFDVMDGTNLEIVHSLAKWKRVALKDYGFSAGEGLYTDMIAIRRDEEPDNIHSMYVDQWDWEKIISKGQRKLCYLKSTVKKIYSVILSIAKEVNKAYPILTYDLPDEICFITTKELEAMYPNLSGKERENAITKEKKAVFLMQIGVPLASGKPHDGRAADYDDWRLNGDLLLWHAPLNMALELSSMGIRVDEVALVKQLEAKNELYKLENDYCKSLINKELPYTIGGGIGQSRLCMYFLKKVHIGEVQASLWPDEMVKKMEEENVILL
jgi:aspartate--ammonia ligase